mmetsp:Transcript_91858/g.196859  ORF Transcript_91858/g.196859 Transcript_91858/m.196859 type:complete len:212 (-) Transcript_91858:186-821(-)
MPGEVPFLQLPNRLRNADLADTADNHVKLSAHLAGVDNELVVVKVSNHNDVRYFRNLLVGVFQQVRHTSQHGDDLRRPRDDGLAHGQAETRGLPARQSGGLPTTSASPPVSGQAASTTSSFPLQVALARAASKPWAGELRLILRGDGVRLGRIGCRCIRFAKTGHRGRAVLLLDRDVKGRSLHDHRADRRLRRNHVHLFCRASPVGAQWRR